MFITDNWSMSKICAARRFNRKYGVSNNGEMLNTDQEIFRLQHATVFKHAVTVSQKNSLVFGAMLPNEAGPLYKIRRSESS